MPDPPKKLSHQKKKYKEQHPIKSAIFLHIHSPPLSIHMKKRAVVYISDCLHYKRRKKKSKEQAGTVYTVPAASPMEAPGGFEPPHKGFADLCLPTWLWRRTWSGLRGSNSLPPPWQGGALPDELNPQNGASDRNRTNDTGIFSPLLYRLSYRGKFKMSGGYSPEHLKWRPGWGSNPRPLA